MDEAIDVELKLGELLRNDVVKELAVIQTTLDSKLKRLDSHFESLAAKIDRKREEAIEEIRVREEARLEELRLKEVRIERLRSGVFGEILIRSKGIEDEMERLERFEESVREREAEIERRSTECRKLVDENVALREEVKLLTEKLEAKSKVPGRDEQLEAIQKFLSLLSSAVCNLVKDPKLSGQELFIIVRDSINDQGDAISKVRLALLGARENAPELVAEALRISYLSESVENSSLSLLGSCRILLLEQLGHVCPQMKSQAQNEAFRVALEWSVQIKSCALKPVEISRFVQFLSMYDIASEFSDQVLVPMLYFIVVCEGTPGSCFASGFSDRITGYIKSMIENNQPLKALDYVTTFKMEKEFSIVKIIQGHLKGLKKNCQRMLKEGVDRKAAEVQVMDFEIITLKELIKCIKDLKLQSIYTTGNLEERMAKLKRQKYRIKRHAPCSDPSSETDPEPPSKKGSNLPGSTKLQKVIPDALNVHPENGSKDLPCSVPNSDPKPQITIKCKLPETAKSAEVALNASDANLEVRSGDLLSFDSNSHPEPQKKSECKLPGTPKSMEIAQNTSNTNQETGSRDVFSLKSNSDPEPLKSKGNNLPESANLTEVPSSTAKANLETVSRDVLCLKPNIDPEPSRNVGSKLPEPAKPQGVTPKEKNTLNPHPENISRDLLSSNPNSYMQTQRKNESRLPGTTKLPEVAQDTSYAIPNIGSNGILSSKPQSYSEPLRNKGFDLPGNAKLREVVLNSSNAYPKIVPRNTLYSQPSINPRPLSNINCNFPGPAKPQETAAPKGTLNACTELGSRNSLHSQEMQKTSLRYDPFHLLHNGVPTGSPVSSISSRPSGYQPPLLPRPPQYYHPFPQLAGYHQPQVPSWHYPVPSRPPCFDFRR